MKIFSTSVRLLALTVAFLSCQKESDQTPPAAPTKTDYITSSAWVHESSGVDVDKNGTIDIPSATAGIASCRLDNILTFKKDKTATADEGASKCDAADPQTSTFNWAFADNEANLVISGNVFSALNGKMAIKTLTATNFTLTKDTVVMAQNVSLIVNLKH